MLPCSSHIVILFMFSSVFKSSLCIMYLLSYLHRWIYSIITIICKIYIASVSHHDTVKKNLPNILQGGRRELWLELRHYDCEATLKCYPLWIKICINFHYSTSSVSLSCLMASITILAMLISLKFTIFLWNSDLYDHHYF